MQNILFFILLTGMLLLGFACQTEQVKTASIPTEPPVKIRVKPTYQAEDRSYQAHWGALDFPVVNDPLPGNKVKQFSISKDSLLVNFYKPMSFSKGGKPMSLDLSLIHI